MITLSITEKQSLAAAKQACKKYHYGSLFHKKAREKYISLQHHLAKKYNCSVTEIQNAEKRST